MFIDVYTVDVYRCLQMFTDVYSRYLQVDLAASAPPMSIRLPQVDTWGEMVAC